MGRKAEFTDDQIIKAGLSIESSGEPVSPFAIRNRLNGGSSMRIKQVWSEFNAQRNTVNVAEVSDEEVELPNEIAETLDRNIATATKQLQKLAADSYKVAQDVAEKRVRSTIEEYKAKVEELEEAENQAALALEGSDQKIDELESQLESLILKNEKLVAENSKLTGKIESIQKRVEQLETMENAHATLQREYGKLEGQLSVLMDKTADK